MNETEIAKVSALEHVPMPEFSYGHRLVLNLKWRADNNSTVALSANEKHLLDLCCWRYRNQLFEAGFDLPKQEPSLLDYVRSDLKLAAQERMI
jgi:hypothetical protein